MSTTQNENNRGIVGITVSGDIATISSSDVQVITLEGSSEGWYFRVGNGYLYAASSEKNYLRTETTKDDNAKATIDMSSDGNATITFLGTNKHNLLRFNSNNSIFSCYGSGQLPVQLYKKVESLIRKIPDVETLVAFRESVNRGDDYSGVEVKLTADLDMSEITTTIDPSSNPSNTWTASIGTEDNPFRGTFNGQGHTISNLKNKANQASGQSVPILTPNGFFGFITGSTIQDLNLTGVNIQNYGVNTDVTSDATEVYTYGFGGLAGVAENSNIINCDVQGSVTYATSNNVGFVVGLMKGGSSVSGCDVSTITLNGYRATGGIVGGIQVDGNKTASITDCSTSGTGIGNAGTGGIAGYVYTANGGSASISRSFNNANITGVNKYVGGIVGSVSGESVTIESCYNTGTISAGDTKYVGGIAGYNKGTITNCYNTGTITGREYVGGIIGHSESNTYSYVYNTGELSGNSTGGIIGAGWGSMSGHCYYLNNVDYGVQGGGIIPDGHAYTDQVSDDMMNFTQLSLSDMQGWKLSSDASDKLGGGKDLGAGTGNARKWIFVRSNLPILTGVRGQSVKILGANGKHNESSSSTYDYTYASFSSDMTFRCAHAFTGVYNSAASRSEFEVRFVQVPEEGTMYGGVDSNGKKKGYTLFQNYNSSNSSFTLEYLPNADATSETAMSLKDGNIFYGTHSYTTSEEMKVSNGRLYSLSVIDGVAAYRPYIGKYLSGNKSYIIYNYADVAQSLGTESSASPTENQVKPAAIFLSNLFVEPEAVLLGDVDVDGAVTVTDVVKMVNVVLNESADDVIMKHGDVNGDGDLDVADVVAIVNKVLGVENDVKSRKVNSVANGGDEASLELNDGAVDFLLSNSSAFCAFQFYMSAEDGLDCKSIILSARAKGHTVSMNKLSDGRYKVMCYSGVNKSFEGSEGELFNILTSGASGKLTLEDLFFVTPGASKVKFGNMDIDVVATGISGIDADANGNANTIFDLSGRRVQKAQKGVYIVNGKKVIL